MLTIREAIVIVRFVQHLGAHQTLVCAFVCPSSHFITPIYASLGAARQARHWVGRRPFKPMKNALQIWISSHHSFWIALNRVAVSHVWNVMFRFVSSGFRRGTTHDHKHSKRGKPLSFQTDNGIKHRRRHFIVTERMVEGVLKEKQEILLCP